MVGAKHMFHGFETLSEELARLPDATLLGERDGEERLDEKEIRVFGREFGSENLESLIQKDFGVCARAEVEQVATQKRLDSGDLTRICLGARFEEA